MRLLLDEHVSPAVAEVRCRTGVDAVALRAWQGGRQIEASDEVILGEAAREGRVLVTYDQRTIPPLLKLWAETGRTHGGVIFVDHLTVRPDDVGGLARALVELTKRLGASDWTDRAAFLRRAPR